MNQHANMSLIDLNLLEKVLQKYSWKVTIVKKINWIGLGVAFMKELKEKEFKLDISQVKNSLPDDRKYYLIGSNGH